MKNVELTLEEKRCVYLRLLKELDRYCTEHHLRYYMGCGTLIGAVRHKGFIPWDDDLDVFMPQPDFDILEQNYSSDHFELRTCQKHKDHPYTFARLTDLSTFSVLGKFISAGLGIDIYIIYGAPSDRTEQIKHMSKVLKYIHRKKNLLKLRNGLVKKNLWVSKSLDFPLMNKTLLYATKELRKYSFDDCNSIWPYGGGRLNLRKELYGNPVRLQFEDGMFYAPECYDEVLKAAYGDYMQLPPEDKRHPYHGGHYYWK